MLKLNDMPSKSDSKTFDKSQNGWRRDSLPDRELGSVSENRTVIVATADREVSSSTNSVLGDEQQWPSPDRNQPMRIYTSKDYNVAYTAV